MVSGHARSWVNMCIASHMQTCAMCPEQCVNAHVAHVCNALCADLYVCAPLCACSAIVHLGLHAKCAVNSLCLCLKCKGARCESKFAKCVWHVTCIVAFASYIVVEHLQVLNRLRKQSNTVLWNEWRRKLYVNTCAFCECFFSKKRLTCQVHMVCACRIKTNWWTKGADQV